MTSAESRRVVLAKSKLSRPSRLTFQDIIFSFLEPPDGGRGFTTRAMVSGFRSAYADKKEIQKKVQISIKRLFIVYKSIKASLVREMKIKKSAFDSDYRFGY